MPIVSSFRPAARALRALFAACATLTAALAQSPSAADGFDPNVDGNVYALAAQPDGRVILGGQFSVLRPGIGAAAGRANLARVNVDGSLDFSFDPGANGPIRALVLQSDGRILVGGDFTTIAGVARTRLARLNADGTLDATFNPGTINAAVNAILVQPDGRIVIGGAFTSVGGVTRNRCARLSAAGVVEAAFNPNFNNIVFALALHGGGKILVGGAFTSMQPAGASAPTGRGRFARLNADGTPDSEFNGGANGAVYAIAVQRDGRIVFGGAFTTVQPIPTPAAQSRAHLARLQADGQFDSSFYSGVAADVNALIVMPDGALLAGGSFSAAFSGGVAPSSRNFLARFSADGTLDQSFAPGVNQAVAALVLLPDGKFVAGGYFTRASSRGVPAGVVRNRLARFHADGALDATFAPDEGGRPLLSVVQPDGKILIGGTFSSVAGVTRNFLARLNADGSLDTPFNPNLNGVVRALALQSDGKILVGGQFTTVGGVTRNNLARLNANGTLDTAFNPGPDASVDAIAVQSDGKILVGGSFFSLAFPIAATATTAASPTTTRTRLARLNADGTLDNAFDPGANGNVLAIVLQSDGKILLGGAFTTFTPNASTNNSAATVTRNGLARLNTDGTVDTTYEPSPNGGVIAIALQSDGKAIVGGTFGNFQKPTETTAVVRLRLARINTDGTVDTTFDPGANGLVRSVTVQGDGKILIGGDFTTLTPAGDATWTQRFYAARLETTGKVDATFNLNLDERSGNNVTSLRVQSDGKVLVCGGFKSLQPVGATARTARSYFVRVNANSSLDTAFVPGVGGASAGTINAFAIGADGRIVVAGAFSDLGGAGTANLARFTAEGVVDTSFNRATGSDGAVNAVALRPDLSGISAQFPGFAWLNPTGTALAPAFQPSRDIVLSGTISAYAFEADGSLLLGGSFANLSNTTGGNLIRIRSNGTLDTSFNPSPNGSVSVITIQNDGRILIAGSFTALTPNGGATVNRTRVARLNRDGTATRFDPSPNGPVTAMIEQPDGQILLAGQFTTLTPNSVSTTTTTTATATGTPVNSTNTVNNADGSTTTTTISTVSGITTTTVTTTSGGTVTTRNYVARVTTDGDAAPNFDPNPNGSVNAMVLQADGKIVVGGTFTSLSPSVITTTTTTPNAPASSTTVTNPDGSTTTTNISTTAGTTTTVVTTTATRNFLARLNPNGTLDTAYNPNPNADVYALALQADGKVLVGGKFTLLGTTQRYNLARINTDGGTDAGFDPNANNAVSLIAVQPDGRILVGGSFTTLQAPGTPSVPRGGIARIGANGVIDLTFDPAPNSYVTAFGARADGTVLLAGNFTALNPGGVMFVGGTFTYLGGLPVANLAALNADGSANSSFAPNPNGAVNALLFQPDGKLVVGGAFTSIAGQARSRLARFNVDGTLDAAFSPTVAFTVNSLGLQPDGRLLAGGGVEGTGGGVVRLNANGSADATFNAPQEPTFALAIQPDGRVLAESVSTIGGRRTRSVRRLNADGSIDSTFNNALTAGSTGSQRPVLLADGRIVVVGTVSGDILANLRRLNATGDVDNTFAPDAFGASAVAVQTDGRVVIGGGFKSVGGLARGGLARLAATGTAAQALTISGGTGATRNIVWTRDGASMELSSVRFDVSTDSRNWTNLTANAQRATGGRGWQSGNVTVPTSAPFYVRVRGLVASGTGTSGVVEQVQQFNVSPTAAFAGTAAALVAGAVIDSKTGEALYVQTSSAGNGDFLASAFGAAPVVTEPANPTVPPVVIVGDPATARLANLSVRARVTTASPIITGFAISGTAPRTVLLRGVGPSLGVFGVSAPLAQPRLQLFDSNGRLLLENNGWAATSANVAEVGAAQIRTGAFPFAANSGNDAAVAITLAPGAYSMQVQDRSGTGGIALAEIYDADTSTASKLVNISSRSIVSTDDGAFISGFVVTGGSKNLLVRGLGPALTQFGVGSTLTDPIVSVYDATGRLVTTNDNWSNPTNDGVLNANTAALTALSAQVSAFPLTPGSNDAALSITLAPGAYTVQVNGAAATATGAAMLEVYELP